MFSWQFNDAELPANPNIVPNGNQLTVNSVTEDAGGVYRCTVSTINNGQTTLSSTSTLYSEFNFTLIK